MTKSNWLPYTAMSNSETTNGRMQRIRVTVLIPILTLAGALAQMGFSSLTLAQMIIPLSTIHKGHSSGVQAPMQIVIRSQRDWEALWKKHSPVNVTPLPPPHVDFSTEMVVGVFLGQKSTGGYEVEVSRVKLTQSNLIVYYREGNPPADAMVIQVITQPHHLVRLARYDAPIAFSRENSKE